MPDGRRRIAVVGATGAVGREALRILAERSVPAERIEAIASERSSGEVLPYGTETVRVQALTLDHLRRCDVALFCADSEVARTMAPVVSHAGGVAVDNSSAFRSDPRVPLVIPEVNGDALHTEPPPKLVANPNCSTILLLVAVEPLRRAFGIERVVVSTYQAVSGAGQRAIEELEQQTRAVLNGEPPRPSVFPEPCAFNVFNHESPIDPQTGLNGEEQKIIAETRRIWGAPGARVVPTCARVPVWRAHSQAVTLTLATPASEHEVREALQSGSGVCAVDDRVAGRFPTPVRASHRDPVFVGRVRPAPDEIPDAAGRVRTFCLWLSGDQLRKGAALNAIQIIDALFGRDWLSGSTKEGVTSR